MVAVGYGRVVGGNVQFQAELSRQTNLLMFGRRP